MTDHSAWGLTMSAYNLGTQPKTLAFQSLSYFIGCTIGHAAGCVWDDICDYDLDRRIGQCFLLTNSSSRCCCGILIDPTRNRENYGSTVSVGTYLPHRCLYLSSRPSRRLSVVSVVRRRGGVSAIYFRLVCVSHTQTGSNSASSVCSSSMLAILS